MAIFTYAVQSAYMLYRSVHSKVGNYLAGCGAGLADLKDCSYLCLVREGQTYYEVSTGDS